MYNSKKCFPRSKTLLTPEKIAVSECGDFHESFIKSLVLTGLFTLFLMVIAAVIVDETLKVVEKAQEIVAAQKEKELN